MRVRIISFIALLALVGCASSSSSTATPDAVTKVAVQTPTPAVATTVAMPTPMLAEGSLTQVSFASKVLGGNLDYLVYLPAGYETARLRYPAIYLLHGRGDNLASWARIKASLDELIAQGKIPPTIAILPDAPSSKRGNYFVDSEYTGADMPGAQVETAFVRELIPQVDAAYRTITDRAGRAIGGYSMGGYGALRYALVYPEMFSAAMVLSPAVYVPLPPADSSTREFGAFGRGETLFVDEIYQAKNYPALLNGFAAKNLQLRLFIAVGDDEYKNPKPEEARHDIDFEAHLLFNRVTRVPNIAAELRVLDGGHSWDVWKPAFREGALYIFRYMRPPE